jgi:hypothetical protein
MSECSCQINVDLDESVELLSEKQVTARKARQCGECDRDILPGEKYLRESYVYDGEFYHETTCLDCLSIRDHLFCDWYYRMILETLRTEILEYDLVPPEACIAKLTPRAREMVCEMIEEQWEDEEETA